MSHIQNVYLGVLPNLVVLCLIGNDDYNFLALYVDEQQVPNKQLQQKFAVGACVRRCQHSSH